MSILTAALGYGTGQFFSGALADAFAVGAFAAGALLVMLTDSMNLESLEHGGARLGCPW